MMLSPQWESRSEFYVHSGNATAHSTRKLLVHTSSLRLSATGTGTAQLVGSYRNWRNYGVISCTATVLHGARSIRTSTAWCAQYSYRTSTA